MDNQEVKKKFYEKMWFRITAGIVAFTITVIALTGGSDTDSPASAEQEQAVETPQEAPPVAEASTEDKAKAQAELDEVIALAKKSGLVSSYEFSERANVVYVTDMWYSLDVSFKKDLMGKIASLKEAITTYHWFEVRHAQSNEKVGEVTSFSGSIEVYK